MRRLWVLGPEDKEFYQPSILDDQFYTHQDPFERTPDWPVHNWLFCRCDTKEHTVGDPSSENASHLLFFSRFEKIAKTQQVNNRDGNAHFWGKMRQANTRLLNSSSDFLDWKGILGAWRLIRLIQPKFLGQNCRRKYRVRSFASSFFLGAVYIPTRLFSRLTKIKWKKISFVVRSTSSSATTGISIAGSSLPVIFKANGLSILWDRGEGELTDGGHLLWLRSRGQPAGLQPIFWKLSTEVSRSIFLRRQFSQLLL